MHTTKAPAENSISDNLKTAILALILVGVSFGLQGNIGISLADEGFLWYGSWRTALGEIPRLDFKAYDPARYFWTAGWSLLFGDGILALRTSVAIFQAIGLFFGLLTLRRIHHSWWILCIAGLLLLIWMFPRHKLFEHSLTMAGVYFAALLIEKPSLLRHFAAGIFVGVAAFFGRNHGFYTFTSFFFLLLFIWFKIERSTLIKRIVVWGTGIVVGYSPMIFMFLFVPGFFVSFFDNVLYILRRESFAIPLQVPWPWLGNFSQISELSFAKMFSTGMFFILLPAFYVLTGVSFLWLKRDTLKQNAPLVASVFIGLTYMHHAFGRADIGHLAQAIHPFLIGVLTLPLIIKHGYKKPLGIGVLAILATMSWFSIGMVSPFYGKLTSQQDSFVSLDIHGNNLWVNKRVANLIESVKKINAQRVLPEEGLLIAPHWPTMYPILQRKSPLWEIYFLWKASKETQQKQIRALNQNVVNWVILGDVNLDGRDDLRFRNTHPFLWGYIMEHFEPVSAEGLPLNYQLLRRTSQ